MGGELAASIRIDGVEEVVIELLQALQLVKRLLHLD